MWINGEFVFLRECGRVMKSNVRRQLEVLDNCFRGGDGEYWRGVMGSAIN